MSAVYAHEKFSQAVHTLVTGNGTVQSRLADAAIHLILLQPADLPKNLQEKFADIRHNLTKEKDVADEGKISATTKAMTNEQGAKIAEQILDIYIDLYRNR